MDTQPTTSEAHTIWDCAILGTGPAGLTALTYLARFHRRVVAIGSTQRLPRLLLIDRTYHLPGFPAGVPGSVLMRRLHEQATEMGGEIVETIAKRVEGKNGNFTVQLEDGPPLRARKIILAMGVHDREPDIPDISRHAGHFLRYCPVCDGFEHTDKHLGIIGSGPSVARHALFLRTFSDHITIFLHGASIDSLGRYRDELSRQGIEVHQPRIVKVLQERRDEESEYTGSGVGLEDGSEHPLGVLYSALGCDVNLAPVHHLDLRLDDEGYIITDCKQESSVPGIYAAGDICSQINQISVAFGQAAIAAVNVHNNLDDEEE
jgi:thioredoxin reductase (NADPH)